MEAPKLVIGDRTITLSLDGAEKLELTPEIADAFEQALQGIVARNLELQDNARKEQMRLPRATWSFEAKPA